MCYEGGLSDYHAVLIVEDALYLRNYVLDVALV
jgi:hypothetical protein